MRVVVGLGNPGQEYSQTRHNVGFITLDQLAERWQCGNWRFKHEALVSEYRGGAEPVVLVKPQTYMNLSGVAVASVLNWYKLKPEDVVVIFDDLDLPTGKLRLRLQGGSGGHKGIESILVHLGKDTFTRVRIGIGRPPAGWETANYVLGRFTADEKAPMEDSITRAADAVESILKHGVDKAMNEFNK